MDERDLECYLKRRGIWHRFISKPETVHTADAAKVSGIALSRITKNLVSETDIGEHVLLIVPGNRKVDLPAAANALGVGNVALIPFNKSQSVSGYTPGGTPSLGHKNEIRSVLDESLLSCETVFCGGGSRDRLLELRPCDIVEFGGAFIARISKNP